MQSNDIAFGDTRLPDYFWSKIRIAESGCWEWTASKNPKGYGQFCFSTISTRLAHRGTYIALVGDIPAGLQIDHLCRVRHCVNPTHLEPVTPLENQRRGRGKRGNQPYCLRGHDLANARVARGRRNCRECAKIHAKKNRSTEKSRTYHRNYMNARNAKLREAADG